MMRLATDVLAVVPLRPACFPWLSALWPHLVVGLAGLALVVLLWWRRGWRWGLLAAGGLGVAGGSAFALTLALPQRRGTAAPAGRPAVATGPWLTFMGSNWRTGCAAGTSGPRSGELLWSFRDGLSRAPFGGSPAVYGGKVYVGSDNRKLYCFDALSGQVAWEFKAAHEIFAAPVVANGRVFVGEGLHYSEGSKLYCLDAASGEPLWEFPTTSHIEFSPTLFGGKLYVAAGEDGVYCLDPASGRELWRHGGVHVDMSPAVASTGVFFGSVYGEPAFFCLRASDGELAWRTPAPYGVCGSPSTDGQRVYFGLGNGDFSMSHARPKGSVWCLAAADGAKVWSREVNDAVLTTVALAGGSAWFGSRDGHLYCVDAASGDVRWAFAAGEPILSSPAVAAGRVYFGCDDGCLYCVDAASGQQVWKFDTSELAFSAQARIVSSPAVAHDRVYVGSMNLLFLCLGARDAP